MGADPIRCAAGRRPPAGLPRTRCASPIAGPLLGLAARDLCGAASLEAAAGELADLAAATLEAALGHRPRRAAGGRRRRCRLAVIGMGKGGGRELNYVSDVDVIFVAEP